MLDPKFLMLCHRVPYPPDKGDRIRSYRLLRQLTSLGGVDLGFLTDEPVPPRTQSHLREICDRVTFASVAGWQRWARASWYHLTGRSVTDGLFHSARFGKTVDGWLRQTPYDAIVTYSSAVLQYVLDRGLDDRLVVDLVDVDSQKWFDYARRAHPPLSWPLRAEGERVRQIERRASQAEAVVLISEAEAKLYREFCPDANIVIATNGVALDYFQPQAAEERPICLFVGYLDYRANVLGLEWFCREVWPGLRARFPEAVFEIVGRNPTKAVRKLARHPGVEIIGPVEDVRAYLAAARVVVVPLRVARGIQNKVLEAMSMGKAVVATPVALEGISAVVSDDVLCADTPADWVEAVDSLWRDPSRRQQIGRNARNFVETHHDWDNCLRPLLNILSRSKSPEPSLQPVSITEDVREK